MRVRRFLRKRTEQDSGPSSFRNGCSGKEPSTLSCTVCENCWCWAWTVDLRKEPAPSSAPYCKLRLRNWSGELSRMVPRSSRNLKYSSKGGGEPKVTAEATTSWRGLPQTASLRSCKNCVFPDEFGPTTTIKPLSSRSGTPGRSTERIAHFTSIIFIQPLGLSFSRTNRFCRARMSLKHLISSKSFSRSRPCSFSISFPDSAYPLVGWVPGIWHEKAWLIKGAIIKHLAPNDPAS